MKHEEIKHIIEALLFASDTPLTIDTMLSIFEDWQKPTRETIRIVLAELSDDYLNRAIELKEVASGFRFQTKQGLSAWIEKLFQEKPAKYSKAMLEALAIIAYKQPVTRGDIEEIRGVAVNTSMIRSLIERGWIRIVGYRDMPGKPALYVTTKEFLDYFNLQSISGLPKLKSLKDEETVVTSP